MIDLKNKLIAAADMIENGDEVDPNELEFLLRYAADELSQLDRENKDVE